MTLLDFWLLIKRYLILVVAIPLVFALAALVFSIVFSQGDDSTYTATARIIVSTHVEDVAGLSHRYARANTSEEDGIKVTGSGDPNTNTVAINVITNDENLSVEMANAIALDVEKAAEAFVPSTPDDPFKTSIEEAVEAKNDASSSGSPMKRVVIAFIAGLVAAICVLIGYDVTKKPIKSMRNIKAVSDTTVFDASDGIHGVELMAVCKDLVDNHAGQPISVCLVPIHENAALSNLAAQIETRFNALLGTENKVTVTYSNCLGNDIEAVCNAWDADVVIVVVKEWVDSLSGFKESVAEFRTAGMKVVAVAYTR